MSGRHRFFSGWRVIWLIVLVQFCGCVPTTDHSVGLADTDPPRILSERKPIARFAHGEFVTTDGQRLPLRRWLPSGRAKAVILALHGFNDYSRAFEVPAKAWVKAGIALYAYDQRGFGAAPGRGFWPGRAALVADVVAACDILRRLYPGVPLYLLGESMGGAVAVIALTGESGTAIPNVDGVILSAPAVWGRATMDLLPRIALWAGVRLIPGLKLTGQSLHILASDNIAMLRALARDPLVIKETRVDTIWGLVNLMDAALASAPQLRVPLLFMYGAHDEVIPKRPIERFVRALPRDIRNRQSFAYYPHGYHMLLRDLEGQTVTADIAGWILRPGMPLLSGADRGAIEAELGRTTQALFDPSR